MHPPPPRPALPCLHTLRLLLAPALVFIVTALDRGYQTELWQHLARGRLIAREHAIISADRFTFTVPGRPLRDNNWLSQLLYYGLHSAGGIDLVQTVNALTLAAAVALLVHLCRRQSGSTRVAAAVGVCAFLGLWQTLLIRPQSFSMLLFVALHALLLAARRRPALLVLTPPLMALWANVHGGFAVGLLLMGTFAAPAAWRRLRQQPSSDSQPFYPWPACLLASAVATLLNPYGWDVYRYAGNLSALGVARGIEEWLPPSPDTLVGAAFAASLAAVAVLALRARRHVTLHDVCLLACFAAPACVSVRMTVWWFLAAAPVAARLAASAIARERAAVSGSRGATGGLPASVETRACEHHDGLDSSSRPSWPAAVALAAIVLACIASLPWFEQYTPLFGAARSPHRTESDLDSLARPITAAGAADPRVFTRLEWANYLAWQSDGRTKVFAEGHVELYPDDTWSEYVTVNDARPGWRAVLDRHGVKFLLLDQTYHAALLSEVRRTHEWSPVSRAGDALLFERRTPLAGGAEGPTLSDLPR